MSSEDDNKESLVPSQRAALSRAGAASLATRGLRDLLQAESANAWYERGNALWKQANLDRDGKRDKFNNAVACYRRGLEVNPNHVGLQFVLGLAYDHGWGVARDLAEAVRWYRKATEQGHVVAAAFLEGKLFSLLYSEVAERIDPDLATDEADRAKRKRLMVQANQAYDQRDSDALRRILEEGRATLAWREKPRQHEKGRHGAEAEGADAWYERGKELWRQGRSRWKDAVACFRRGIEMNPNHAGLQHVMGFVYEIGGGGVAKDETEALRWYRKAAEQGHAIAQWKLGWIYEHGDLGVARDEAESRLWYRKAENSEKREP